MLKRGAEPGIRINKDQLQLGHSSGSSVANSFIQAEVPVGLSGMVAEWGQHDDGTPHPLDRLPSCLNGVPAAVSWGHLRAFQVFSVSHSKEISLARNTRTTSVR